MEGRTEMTWEAERKRYGRETGGNVGVGTEVTWEGERR